MNQRIKKWYSKGIPYILFLLPGLEDSSHRTLYKGESLDELNSSMHTMIQNLTMAYCPQKALMKSIYQNQRLCSWTNDVLDLLLDEKTMTSRSRSQYENCQGALAYEFGGKNELSESILVIWVMMNCPIAAKSVREMQFFCGHVFPFNCACINDAQRWRPHWSFKRLPNLSLQFRLRSWCFHRS